MGNLITTETLVKVLEKRYLDLIDYDDDNRQLLDVGKIYDIETCEPEIFIKVKFLGWELDGENSYNAIFEPLENIKINGAEMYYTKPELIKE